MKTLVFVLFIIQASICVADSVTIQKGLGTRLNQYLERFEGFGFSGQVMIVTTTDS